MKLGEALTLRARQAQKLNDLQGRIRANVLTQEGTKPTEAPGRLLSDYITLSNEHCELVRRIAETNLATAARGTSATTHTLLDLLSERSAKRAERAILQLAADTATPARSDYRFTRTELKYVPNVDVPFLRGDIEKAEEAIRVIDANIQRLNWTTELL